MPSPPAIDIPTYISVVMVGGIVGWPTDDGQSNFRGVARPRSRASRTLLPGAGARLGSTYRTGSGSARPRAAASRLASARRRALALPVRIVPGAGARLTRMGAGGLFS